MTLWERIKRAVGFGPSLAVSPAVPTFTTTDRESFEQVPARVVDRKALKMRQPSAHISTQSATHGGA